MQHKDSTVHVLHTPISDIEPNSTVSHQRLILQEPSTFRKYLKYLLHFEVLAALYCLLQVLTGPAKGGAPLGSLVSISALQLCTAEIISRVGEKHCKTFLQHSSPLSEEFVSPRCEQCERLSVVERKTNKPFLQIDNDCSQRCRVLEGLKMRQRLKKNVFSG